MIDPAASMSDPVESMTDQQRPSWSRPVPPSRLAMLDSQPDMQGTVQPGRQGADQQTVGHPGRHEANKPDTQALNQAASQLATHPTRQPACQAVNQAASQLATHPIRQPACQALDQAPSQLHQQREGTVASSGLEEEAGQDAGHDAEETVRKVLGGRVEVLLGQACAGHRLDAAQPRLQAAYRGRISTRAWRGM